MIRKTANEWRISYKFAIAEVDRVRNNIKSRLKELIRNNPDIIINVMDDVDVKLKTLDNESFFDSLTIERMIQYIEKIEKYFADQHPHKQQELF